MISQLSSGTPLNPTLSVVAPPGLQFYNDLKCVPLAYGNALVEGTIIADMSATAAADFINSPDGWGASLWQAICFGKIKLNTIWYLAAFTLLTFGDQRLISNVSTVSHYLIN